MKKLTIIFTAFLLFISCNKKDEEKQNLLFDFGIGRYEEPFSGLLKSKPNLLVKSLKYPPFKWAASDTVILNKSFIIDFSEEAIHSNSTATISFVDSLYQPFNGLYFYCNGVPFEKGQHIIYADSTTKALNIKCHVLPQFGENLAKGHLIIQGNELDMVNLQALQQEYNVVADWQSEQKMGWPVMLWLSWLLVGILAVAIIVFVIYYIVLGLLWVAKSVANMFSKRSNRSDSFTNKIKKEAKSSGEEKPEKLSLNNRKHIHMLNYYNRNYNENNSIHKRACALRKMVYHYRRLSDDDLAITLSKLPNKTIVDIKAVIKTERLPRSNGKWTGEPGNSKWIFDDDFIPEIYNPNNLTWAKIREEYKKDHRIIISKGIKYKNNEIDLKSIAVAKVKVKFEKSNFKRGSGKKSIQVLAEEFFTKKLRRKIKKGGYKDYWEYKAVKKSDEIVKRTPFTPHEDYDCQTIYLVPKLVHDNISHYGGMALAKIIRGY